MLFLAVQNEVLLLLHGRKIPDALKMHVVCVLCAFQSSGRVCASVVRTLEWSGSERTPHVASMLSRRVTAHTVYDKVLAQGTKVIRGCFSFSFFLRCCCFCF